MSAPAIVNSLLDFRRLDLLACGDSALHRLDSRAKVLVTLAFIVCAMSYDRYALAPLVPFFVFPVATILRSRTPAGYVARKVALVLPVALLIGVPNLWFDRAPMIQIGSVTISGGQVSLLSILLKSLLAAAAAILLVAVTGFASLCGALERLGMPRALAVQLLFLYRYLVVLGDEALRMTAARELRGNDRPLSARLYGTLVGRLLLRTWDRAERIYRAMCARGFTGDFRSGPRTRVGTRDVVYIAGWILLFVWLRTQDVTHWLGASVLEAFG